MTTCFLPDPGQTFKLYLVQAKCRKRERKREMKKQDRKKLGIALVLLGAFVLWTAAVRCVDVRPIGPRESQVGFAALNGFFHNLTIGIS